MLTFLEQWALQIVAAIPNILTALTIFLVGLYLASLLSRLLKKALERRRVAYGAARLLTQMLYWTVAVIVTVTALQRFFDVTAFLAGLGILGFTVGFALQDVMKNFAAGILLLLNQPFHVGEAVGVAGFDGTILAIDLRTTEMKTLDGRIVTLPNADILAGSIVNYTRAYRRRVDLTMDVSHDADPEAVRSIVLEAVRSVPGFIGDPAPVAVFQAMAGPSVSLAASFWIDVSKTNPPEAKDAAITRVKAAFKQSGIPNPIPAQKLYLQSQTRTNHHPAQMTR
ncbi:MAG: mechanosensitive ion channel [Chloroflexota bacterium]